MALTYLNTQMIEQPPVFDQLSATNLQIGSITNNTNVLGDLTVYGTLTALSGFNVVIASTTSTSALSVNNIQPIPALEVYQGPASSVISLFKNQTGDIVTITDTGLTVSGVLSTTGSGDSNLWHNTYTQVQTSSALWGSNIDTGVRGLTSNWESTYQTVSTLSSTWATVPTITNYLSTNEVVLSSVSTSNLVVLSSTAPSLSTDSGLTGTLKWDTNYLYICVNTDTWKRVALSAWN